MEEQLAIIRQVGGLRETKRCAWEQVISHWKHSGLGVTAFCQQHRIPVKRFFKWRAKLSAPTGANVGRFVQVEPAACAVAARGIELHIGGARVVLPPEIPLSQLISVLREAAC